MSASYGHTISIDFFTAFFTPRTPRENTRMTVEEGWKTDRLREVTACELELSSHTGRRGAAHLLFVVAAAPVFVVVVAVLFDRFGGSVRK